MEILATLKQNDHIVSVTDLNWSNLKFKMFLAIKRLRTNISGILCILWKVLRGQRKYADLNQLKSECD